ncbi:hypothetical protein [Streptomyces sp. NPDC058297]|uniref:hypothetical protein n=1 Tax=Streptomyces sp. NPDC058297 TaxID=3346433 RepID=UPI0036E50040
MLVLVPVPVPVLVLALVPVRTRETVPRLLMLWPLKVPAIPFRLPVLVPWPARLNPRRLPVQWWPRDPLGRPVNP